MSRTSGIPAGLVRWTTAYFWLHWFYIFQTREWYIGTSDFYNPLARRTSAFNLKFQSLQIFIQIFQGQWVQGLRLVVEGFVVMNAWEYMQTERLLPMALELDVLFPHAQVHCDSKPQEIGLNLHYRITEARATSNAIPISESHKCRRP